MIKTLNFLLPFIICLFFVFSCKHYDEGDNKTQVKLIIQAAYHLKVYLRQIPFNGGHSINIDSAVPQYGVDSFLLHIPEGEEGLFMITVAGTNVQLPLINDSKNIVVYYNYATHKFSIEHSAASEELKIFEDEQFQQAKKMRAIKSYIDSFKTQHRSTDFIKDSVEKLDSMSTAFFKRYKNFADTVQSPAAFMAVYNAIDFGNNRAALKVFISNAAARFPHHAGIQTLAKNVSDYIRIFETQYKAGDTLPELILPDQYGINFSTYSLKGKYALINIWSTLCDDCIQYSEVIKKLKQEFPYTKFEAVNIALDDEKQAWLNIIKQRAYNWPQLIDVNMWNGSAFKTLKFDSIPYNFLVSPDGVLIKKAIKADSIETTIRQQLNK